MNKKLKKQLVIYIWSFIFIFLFFHYALSDIFEGVYAWIGATVAVSCIILIDLANFFAVRTLHRIWKDGYKIKDKKLVAIGFALLIIALIGIILHMIYQNEYIVVLLVGVSLVLVIVGAIRMLMSSKRTDAK